MATEKVSLFVRWDGVIKDGSQGINYMGGKLKGVLVRSGISYTELLDKMYDVTGLDKRQFNIKIICRYPKEREYMAYDIDDDDATEFMFQLARRPEITSVEVYLEKFTPPAVNGMDEQPTGFSSHLTHTLTQESGSLSPQLTSNFDDRVPESYSRASVELGGNSGTCMEKFQFPSQHQRTNPSYQQGWFDKHGLTGHGFKHGEVDPLTEMIRSEGRSSDLDLNANNDLLGRADKASKQVEAELESEETRADAELEKENADVETEHGDCNVEQIQDNVNMHQEQLNIGKVSEQAHVDEITSSDWINNMIANNTIPGVQSTPRCSGATLYIGQRFATKDALLHAMKEYAVKGHYQHVSKLSNPKQLVLKCIKSDCPWHLRACMKKGKSFFEITRLVHPHTCVNPIISQDHKQLDSKFICSIIKEVIKSQISTTPASIQEHISSKFGYHISYRKAWHAKQKAMEQLFGNWEESYMLLPRYLEALKVANPDTVYQFQDAFQIDDARVFQRVFWAFGQSIVGYKHCRPVLSIDSTHLYGKYDGTILIANGIDGNNGLLPVAFAIVESENRSGWAWFLDCIRELVDWREGLCVISDHHEDIIAALRRPEWQPPHAFHRFCIRHLASNLDIEFKDAPLKELMGRAAMQNQPWKYVRDMNELAKVNQLARQWLDRIDPSQWALAHDGCHRFGIMTTNLSESINGILKDARCLPITALVRLTFYRVNKYFCERRDQATQFDGVFTPDITLKLSKNANKSKSNEVVNFNYDSGLYKVKTREDSCTGSPGHYHSVKLREQHCTCGKWQLLGYPCSHAMAACHQVDIELGVMVADWCKVEAYKQTYAPISHPLPNMEHWGPYLGAKLIPDKNRRNRGRPRSVRLHNEMDEREGGGSLRCSLCKETGHNIRRCPRGRD